jgi:UDP-N-acetylglucosamine--N-acetylmuramyl-(pentapeptide) pyrophosphoryl-undecaprenol N-acetylglucosamine transferase
MNEPAASGSKPPIDPSPRPSVVIAGGGTGGHLFPALALARALSGTSGERRRGADVRLVGTLRGPEGPAAAAAGIPFEGIDVLGFQRSLTVRNLAAAGKGAAATLRAVTILRRAHADVAVGTGGYASVPVAAAAGLLRIPLVLHEQNAIPGVANRLAGRWAAAVAVSFPGAQRWFRPPVRVTGNPIRSEIAHLDRTAMREPGLEHFELEAGRRTLLVFGGSQGARRINQAVLGAYDRWRASDRLQVLQIVGPKELPAAESRLAAARRDDDLVVWRLVGYTDRMDLAYAAADLAVCRAGAATLFEIAAVGLPAIVIPYPYATADHQRANAEPLVEDEAVEMLLDADCTPDVLAAAVEKLLFDDERLAGMATSLARFARPDAAEALAELVLEVGARM